MVKSSVILITAMLMGSPTLVSPAAAVGPGLQSGQSAYAGLTQSVDALTQEALETEPTQLIARRCGRRCRRFIRRRCEFRRRPRRCRRRLRRRFNRRFNRRFDRDDFFFDDDFGRRRKRGIFDIDIDFDD